MRDVALAARMWTPQPGPQTAFVKSEVFEVIYGGARGGGKTDAALGDFALHANRYGAGARGLLVRRTRVALEPTVARARQIFGPAGAVWAEQKSRFVWPSGARLSFRHLDHDSHADAYQGHDYSRVYVEALTQFGDSRLVDKLKATLRSAHGVPCGFRATCNPGGAGHNWVKARYIDAGPFNIITETYTNPFDGTSVGLDRMFIPARLTDNPKLLANDPLYVARLAQSGSKELVRAWLEGDWDIIEGAFFDQWSASRNVCKPFVVPAPWTRFRSFDEGYAAPFSVGWWAIATDDVETPQGQLIARGAMVRYREWYGCGGKPNEGVRLTAEEIAKGIQQRERGETIAYGVADTSIFARKGERDPSVAERMTPFVGRQQPADKRRFDGWDQMRARIKGTEDGAMLFVFDTCRDFIRTVPVLQHDPARAEDLDTDGEDHIADETRYACMSRPMTAKRAQPSVNPTDLGWGAKTPEATGWKGA